MASPSPGRMLRRASSVLPTKKLNMARIKKEPGTHTVVLTVHLDFAVPQDDPELVAAATAAAAGQQPTAQRSSDSGRNRRNPDPSTAASSSTALARIPSPTSSGASRALALVPGGGRNQAKRGPVLPSHYIHYEFDLPQAVKTCKADIVIHHNLSKVFLEAETRSALFWEEDGKNWAGWSHNQSIVVTRELLLELFRDGLDVKVYDTKDKVSSRARFDRPRMGGGGSGGAGGNAYGLDGATPLPGRKSVYVPGIPEPAAGNEPGPSLSDKILAEWIKRPATNTLEDGKGALIHINLQDLFVGKEATATTVADLRSTGLRNIEAVRVTVTLDQPLLSRPQSRALNPMTVHFHALHCMPDMPTPFSDLDSLCHPTFLKFSFLDDKVHKFVTTSDSHAQVQEFDQQLVVLAGLYTKEALNDFFTSPKGFSVEVHDRDRKEYSDELGDQIFGKANTEQSGNIRFNDFETAVGKSLLQNPLDTTNEAQDPFGIAKFSLQDMQSGVRVLHLTTSVLPCPRKRLQTTTSTGQPASKPMLPGHYVAAGTYLDVTVSFATPSPQEEKRAKATAAEKEVNLATLLEQARNIDDTPIEDEALDEATDEGSGPALPRRSAQHRPFLRCIIRIQPDRGTPAARALLAEVAEMMVEANTKALDLGRLNSEDRNMALSTYELSDEQKSDPHLDVVTGFSFSEPARTLLVLEGTAGGAVCRIWEAMAAHKDRTALKLHTLMNSELRVEPRLYGVFGLTLWPLVVREPLSKLLARTELYVANTPVSECLSGLSQLQELFLVPRMADAVRNSSFPVVETLEAIAKHFGAVKSARDTISASWLQTLVSGAKPGAGSTSSLPRGERGEDDEVLEEEEEVVESGRVSVLESAAGSKQSSLAQLVLPVPSLPAPPAAKTDYIQLNKDSVAKRSEENARNRPKQRYIVMEADEVHSYSSQTLNSGQMAREQLAAVLAEEHPGMVFTYNTGGDFHHSAAFALDNIDDATKREMQMSRTKWRTQRGFDSTARKVVTIAAPAETLRATGRFERAVAEDAAAPERLITTERGPLPWEERAQEMNRHPRPPATFQNEPPTIMLAGDTLRQEQKQAEDREKEAWQAKLVVDSPRFVAHQQYRESPTMTMLEKHRGLLKDRPQKYTLRAKKTALQPMPISANLSEPFHSPPGVSYSLVDHRNGGLRSGTNAAERPRDTFTQATSHS